MIAPMSEILLDADNVVLRYLLLHADAHVIVLALVFTTAIRRAIWEPLHLPPSPFLLVPMGLAAILDVLLDLGLPKPTPVMISRAVNAGATAFTAYQMLGKKKEFSAFVVRLLGGKTLMLVVLWCILASASLSADVPCVSPPSPLAPEMLQEGAAAAELTEEEYLHWLVDYYAMQAAGQLDQAVQDAYRAQQQLETLKHEAQRLLQEQQQR